MRYLGSLGDREAAETFSSYMLTQQIDTSVEQGKDGWAVWVLRDDDIERAGQALEQFQRRPEDPRYLAARDEADHLRAEASRKQRRAKKNMVDVRAGWSVKGGGYGNVLTLALIGASVIVTLLTNFGRDGARADVVQMAHVRHHEGSITIEPDAGARPLAEVRAGEVWRLVTPIFLHYDPLHLLFDMMWLYSMGSMIEQRKGPLFLGIFVLGIALISNIAQYQWAGPAFGGMSGVTAGLFGYVWMKSLFSPNEGFWISRTNVILMLVFLALCTTGFVGPIANGVHVSGLAIGVALGYLPDKLRRARR